MFGFEFQTANAFVRGPFAVGVDERQMAWRHTLTEATLEGDESRRPGATADLEFVTPPVRDRAGATAALDAVTGLAQAILATPPTSDGLRVFAKNSKLAGGVWTADAAIRLYDETFRAQAQGTVGVPLSGISKLLSTVWERTGGHSPSHAESAKDEFTFHNFLNDNLPAYQEAEKAGFHELYGFLTACHQFLIRAMRAPAAYIIGNDLTALHPEESKAVFDLSDRAYARAEAARVHKLPAPPQRVLVKVGSDSPKDMFPLLARTDFHSMYLAVPEKQRAIIAGRPIAEALWPAAWGSPDARIFPLPYRGDPLATDTASRGPAPLTLAEWTGQPVPGLERGPVTWTLVEHGPTVAEWWTSVQHGDARRGGIAKDAASPPAGFRGRDRKYIAKFPDSAVEDKSTYYGMGSFPIDIDKPTNIPLAIFEHRDLMTDQDVPPQDKLTLELWPNVVDVFITHYVPILD